MKKNWRTLLHMAGEGGEGGPWSPFSQPELGGAPRAPQPPKSIFREPMHTLEPMHVWSAL